MRPVLSSQPATEDAERLIATSRHVAEIRHANPGEALITCTCRRLRTAVDVDDRQAVTFVLLQHLRIDADEEDHLLVDDLRTGVLFVVTHDAQPEILLILHRAP